MSIAEAHFRPNAWYRAIALDNVPIGLVMVYIDFKADTPEDNPCHFLWRLMIGEPWQRKGYGKLALDILFDQYRREGIRTIFASCHMEEYGPYRFYMKYGFVDLLILIFSPLWTKKTFFYRWFCWKFHIGTFGTCQ